MLEMLRYSCNEKEWQKDDKDLLNQVEQKGSVYGFSFCGETFLMLHDITVLNVLTIMET